MKSILMMTIKLRHILGQKLVNGSNSMVQVVVMKYIT